MQDVIPENHIIRQVVDIPEIKVNVIEHRAEVKKCPKCRRKNTGKFPYGITNTVQYGEKVKAIDEINILPNFTRTAVNDCFKTYNKYSNCDYSLCNAHILRELNSVSELEKQEHRASKNG